MADAPDGRIGPALSRTNLGRHLTPVGRITAVGDLPTGGALTPDGRFYWAVDSGHGHNEVAVVDVASGAVVQVLALPGAFGGVAFSADGRHAYVSGEPRGNQTPVGPTKAPAGDAIHVYAVDPASGHAVEGDPITLPATTGGRAQTQGDTTGYPDGLAVTPDGSQLLVALDQADQAAIVDLASGASRLVAVGVYPAGAAISRDGRTGYVTNQYSGTVSVIDLRSARVTRTIGVGGPHNPDGGVDANRNAHPKGIVVDPRRRRAYVAVSNRDLVAVLDLAHRRVLRYVDVGRAGGLGTQPVALAVAPDSRMLYVADSGEDAVAAVTLPGSRRPPYRVLGRVPTAAYPTAVALTPRGDKLVWLAAKGLGTGPNIGFGNPWDPSYRRPYGSAILDMLLGRVGVLATPTRSQLAALTRRADAQVRPDNAHQVAAGSPLGDGSGSPVIRHVFYVVRENRTYDQILGSEPRGDGDPALELLDDNGVGGPTGGITPNAHALARQFPLLDHVYADSEVSRDGHKIAAGGYATDFVQRALHANYSGRGQGFNTDREPAAAPPRDFLFDEAIREGISFRNYGEYGANTDVDDGRPTFAQSVAGKDAGYPGRFGCNQAPVSPANCDTDSGTVGTAPGQDAPNSRLDHFEAAFQQQLATDSVPALNYLIMPNDHTNGTTPGRPTPQAEVADNDLGLGQLVDVISHSKIWSSSAIFVVEDDSQDGADHVDAHRMPAFVISPWARHGAVVHDRYDQESVLRTMELILGMQPLSLFDALATPMDDVFADHADPAPYTAIAPEYPLTAVNGPAAPAATLSAALPFDEPDLVPQELSDRVLWQSVHGAGARVPAPGPNASPAEHARALTALRAFRRHRSVRAALRGG
jgi:YVTN family beta-propeller protein